MLLYKSKGRRTDEYVIASTVLLLHHGNELAQQVQIRRPESFAQYRYLYDSYPALMYAQISRSAVKRQALSRATQQPRQQVVTGRMRLSSISRPSPSASATKPSEFDRSPEELRKWNRTWEDPEVR
jgi:hypothetical protein